MNIAQHTRAFLLSSTVLSLSLFLSLSLSLSLSFSHIAFPTRLRDQPLPRWTHRVRPIGRTLSFSREHRRDITLSRWARGGGREERINRCVQNRGPSSCSLVVSAPLLANLRSAIQFGQYTQAGNFNSDILRRGLEGGGGFGRQCFRSAALPIPILTREDT